MIKKIRKLLYLMKRFDIDAISSAKINMKQVKVYFSHSDYKLSIGGTEKFITESINRDISNGFYVIHISPIFRIKYNQKFESIYKVNLNNEFIGCGKIKKLLSLINDWNGGFMFTEIHHFLYYSITDINTIFSYLLSNNIPYNVYIHDMYLIDCNYASNFYDVESIDIKETQELEDLVDKFAANAINVIVPSDYFGHITLKRFHDTSINLKIDAPLDITECTNYIKKYNKRLKIAYLGYQADIKGYSVWKQLITNNILHNFEVYYIGSHNEEIEGVEYITFNSDDSEFESSIEVMEKKNIDIVMLWSLVPESYSYTFHECLLSGVFVITNKDSGNIAYSIKNSYIQNGIVLEDEAKLIEFLKIIEVDRSVINGCKKYYIRK